jgi:hypothetical protein
MGLTNFPNGISSFGVPVFGGVAGVAMTGNYWFVNPATGLDGNSGTSPASPLKTLYKALAHCIDGNNDVVVLIGNGQSSGTARLSLALAQAQDPTVTAGTLVWNKNATHLIGICAPSAVAQRARIAPPTGTYTQATFGSGNFVVVTGSGCVFQNISLFNGFSTGGVNQICWTDNGSRNYYSNVNFGGMADAASAGDAGSRSLKIGSAGSGENTFDSCTIGLDTVTRGAFANASLELAGGTPRNVFRDCTFPMDTTAATPLSILCTGASAIDRWQRFDNCLFLNAMSSGATAQTQIVSMTNASPGGYLAMNNCGFVGDANTNWGDTNALANMYVLGATPLTASNGIMIKPS